MAQSPEILIPGVFGTQDFKLLSRSEDDVVIYSHFNHEGFVFSSSYLAGGNLPVSFTLKEVHLLRESMHVKVRETNPLYLLGMVLDSLLMFLSTPISGRRL